MRIRHAGSTRCRQRKRPVGACNEAPAGLDGFGECDPEFLPLAVCKSLHGVAQDSVIIKRRCSFLPVCCYTPRLVAQVLIVKPKPQ